MAAGIVDKVSIAMNLPVKVAGQKYSYESGSGYRSSPVAPPPTVSEYVEPYVVDDYYYANEPPVVTYYPPPGEYAYLYDWVPDQFWWDGYGFGGFFILADFNRRHHNHHITNHVTNANGTVSRISATERARANATANTGDTSASRNLTSSGSVRDMDRFSSSPGLNHDADSGSPSHSGRTFGSVPSEHFSTGGGSGGGFGGGGGGFGGGGRGGGGFGGGGGGFGGGGRGGGGGHH